MGTYAQPGITQGQALMAEKADYASGLSKTFKEIGRASCRERV